jgi:hypothetical protein
MSLGQQASLEQIKIEKMLIEHILSEQMLLKHRMFIPISKEQMPLGPMDLTYHQGKL